MELGIRDDIFEQLMYGLGLCLGTTQEGALYIETLVRRGHGLGSEFKANLLGTGRSGRGEVL